MARKSRLENLSGENPLDILIVGAGAGGAPLYHQLCANGHRVALIDKGDFSSGTSQASGMLVWGGLLYLRNFDLLTVLKLCKARKDLLKGFPDELSVLNLHFPTSAGGRHPAVVWLALHLYWLLGGCALRRPATVKSTLPQGKLTTAYQEAMLRQSDSRFVIERIRAYDSEHCLPVNHCRLVGAEFDRQQRYWTVMLRDELSGTEHTAKARVIVNSAGVWTDGVNQLLGIESPYKHVFSKGVYLAFPGDPRQTAAHVYPMHGKDDVLTHVPWGPVTMWGPTETMIHDLESGLAPTRDDVRFLIAGANRSLPGKVGAEDVVSIRCGIRPLAVPRNFSQDIYPLDLSRRHQVVVHEENHAISLYGGKLTSSVMVANRVAGILGQWIPPRLPRPAANVRVPKMAAHPELDCDFVTAEWARDHEFCMTLDDYLRRRTNIAQWTPRMGLGRDDAGRTALVKLAETFAPQPQDANSIVDAYEQRVRTHYDPLLAV